MTGTLSQPVDIPRPSAPPGTLTFLFTAIEGATHLWERFPDEMAQARARHDDLLREVIEENGGYVFKTARDAFFAAFSRAPDALRAAGDAQRRLLAENWGAMGSLRVRMALHTGISERRNADFFGPTLNRISRLLAVGSGGQVLLSQSTQEALVGALPNGFGLLDLGLHRLRDLQQPEHVYQLLHSDLPEQFPLLRSLQAYANNLPQQVTSFVGRETEMDEIRELLKRSRLVTLTGAGGSGKTRLALQVGAELLDSSSDGIWLVELAPLADPALVVQTVAAALGLREEPGRAMLQTLTDYLARKILLLILDNCEHLIEASAQLTETLLRACPNVQILATSREPLGVPGETVYRIPTLSVPTLSPEDATIGEAENLAQYEAVRLFLERARSFISSEALLENHGYALAQICCRLDGIPLAIELAAARTRGLSVEQIAQRLDDRFRLLTSGHRTDLPRQQTLRASIDWSYDLLDAPEKRLLQCLSLFSGGFTLEAAEAVSEEEVGMAEAEEESAVVSAALLPPSFLDTLISLVEKSLAVYEERDGQARYRLLETVRQYAAEKLNESGELERVRARHRAYFVKMADAAGPKLRGPEQRAWYETLETEHDNLRTALEACLSEPADVEAGLRMVEGMKLFWCLRGYYAEGQEWVARALAQGADAEPKLRAQALNTGGVLAWFQTDYARLRTMCEQAYALAEQCGDTWCLTAALILLGSGASNAGESERATELLERSIPCAQEVGDPWLIGQALHHSAMNAFHRGANEQATAYAQSALDVARQAGDLWITALAIRTLGFIALDRGNYPATAKALREALRLYQQLRYKWGVATCLEGLARIAGFQNDFAQAARLYGAAEVLREATGAPLPPYGRGVYDRDVQTVREALDAETFAAAWSAGRALRLEQAISFALEEST